MNVALKSLLGKLTGTARRSLEGAAGLCVSRTHYDIEVEHWLVRMLDDAEGDVTRILRHFEIDPDRVRAGLDEALHGLKTGNGRTPQLSADIETVVRNGWLWASINHEHALVRSGVVLLAAIDDANIRRRLREASPLLDRVKPDILGDRLAAIVNGSAEDREVYIATGAADRDPAVRGSSSATPALDRYTRDLTALGREGKIDPVLGRDREIRQIVDILMRRRQNNPILTGEAGVGKTAVVEGFARRIAEGDVPEPLRNVVLRTLDLGLLQAGAGVKGEFENRLKQVIEEVRASPAPIILFIDEAHTMIGAGGQEGQNDAANLLKPALARGELRTIAATTWAEYKKFFEKDAALSRRFQVVKVDEPSEPTAIDMMRGLLGVLEQHHGVRVLDDAVVESVRLSSRYLPARQLPDKSVSVLDTACARVAVQRASTPPAIEDHRRRLDAIDTELSRLEREAATGARHDERIQRLRCERDTVEAELSSLESRWQRERDAVTEIASLLAAIEGEGDADDIPEREAKLEELERLRAELRDLQGPSPLVQVEVDGQTIAEVIGGWTGIPVGRMLADEIQTVLELPQRLGTRVLGQDHALQIIGRRIQTSRARLDNPSRPVGVFLLAGPSGVGKTETAVALAEALYGGERNLISINMSEYQEAHTVSGLKGSPPGYVGYGEGGVLTEAVRRRPYSVVLLDEVEKAHSDVMELFFQVFDKGVLEDGEGREIDFKNTVILLTSNLGSSRIMDLCADPETVPDPEPLTEAIRPELLSHFPAALLGRLAIVPYYPVLPDVLERIARLQLQRIIDRLQQNHAVEMEVDDGFVDWVVGRCQEPESGARNVDRILTQNLLPRMSTEILTRMASGRAVSTVRVRMDGADFAVDFAEP